MARNALKLGGKTKDVDSFVDQLKSEGEKIANLKPTSAATAGGAASSIVKPKLVSDVHTERCVFFTFIISSSWKVYSICQYVRNI